jgi:F-type H+-transporting ATPase subunit b
MHIDWWTLALQAINVLILVWILGRFFWRPVAKIIEERRAAAANVMADASAIRAAAEAEKAQLEAARTGLADERDAMLAVARARIETEHAAMLKDASARIDKLRADSEAMIVRDRAALEQALVQQASALAVQIAQKLLERISSDSADAIFLAALFNQIDALPPKARDELIASAAATGLRLTTASALSETRQQEIQAKMESVLNKKMQISFHADPRLIAGVELSSGALVLRNSWENDLARILQQLKSDDGPK